ncbi:MAG TPA: nucleoside recognition protein, partial [bacterium (Candidatus Stahlbacteria)]|nr:nucleoside recognition protein [Candidatus Stahlbacteria bacterium]
MAIDIRVLLNATKLSLHFLSTSVPFMIAGVILAELIVALKFVDKIAFITKPITNFAHLSDECGTSFIAAFVSPASANSMLASFYNDGLIEKKELFIAAMMNSFPS